MLGRWPGRFPAVDVTTAVLHGWVAAVALRLLAFGPTPGVQGEGGTGREVLLNQRHEPFAEPAHRLLRAEVQGGEFVLQGRGTRALAPVAF